MTYNICDDCVLKNNCNGRCGDTDSNYYADEAENDERDYADAAEQDNCEPGKEKEMCELINEMIAELDHLPEGATEASVKVTLTGAASDYGIELPKGYTLTLKMDCKKEDCNG